jgi:hypothetical protein
MMDVDADLCRSKDIYSRRMFKAAATRSFCDWKQMKKRTNRSDTGEEVHRP